MNRQFRRKVNKRKKMANLPGKQRNTKFSNNKLSPPRFPHSQYRDSAYCWRGGQKACATRLAGGLMNPWRFRKSNWRSTQQLPSWGWAHRNESTRTEDMCTGWLLQSWCRLLPLQIKCSAIGRRLIRWSCLVRLHHEPLHSKKKNSQLEPHWSLGATPHAFSEKSRAEQEGWAYFNNNVYIYMPGQAGRYGTI